MPNAWLSTTAAAGIVLLIRRSIPKIVPGANWAGVNTKSCVPPEIPVTARSSVSAFAGVSSSVSGLKPAAHSVVIAFLIETISGSVPGAWKPDAAIASRISLSRPSL